MPVTITCETEKGGAVSLNKGHGVWASYAVATAGDLPPPETLHVGITLRCGRTVSLFVNRETGLVVVDTSASKGDAGGTELLRTTLTPGRPVAGRRWVGAPLDAPG
jgi:hypothetical protein